MDSGAIVINGTDVPVEPVNPIASFYASVSRKTLNGTPDDGFEPDQKMTRFEALKSYTINAAYAPLKKILKAQLKWGNMLILPFYLKTL